MTRTSKWTVNDIGDLTGKVAIVTGANAGLGCETTRELLRNGARCVMASRNLDKANVARQNLIAELPAAEIEVMPLDLESLASVEAFADQFHDSHDQLDLLINNAGIMMVPYGLTVDGFERQLGTNHLGHFALTGRLFPSLLATPGSRIVTVSSLAHRSGAMNFDNLMFAKGGYTRTSAYARSKLANLLFAYELQRRLEAFGSSTRSVASHPGVVATNLGDHFFERWYLAPLKPVVMFALASTAAGARPTLRAATDETLRGGEYVGPSGLGEQRGAPVVVRSNAASHNQVDAARLWELSEELTGVSFAL